MTLLSLITSFRFTPIWVQRKLVTEFSLHRPPRIEELRVCLLKPTGHARGRENYVLSRDDAQFYEGFLSSTVIKRQN